MYCVSGKYTGDGADNRQITIGFQPDAVFVKGNSTTEMVCRTSTMIGDVSKVMTANLDISTTPNHIQALNTTGFEVGTDSRVNENGKSYYWIAFQATPDIMKVGSYVGNGTDDRSITGVGFQPDCVIILPDYTNYATHRTSAMSGDKTFKFDSTMSRTNIVQALESDGFQVGTDTYANGDGNTYHYIAWKVVVGKFAVGSYTGNGTDNRSITGVGFQPEWVVIKDGTGTSEGVSHPTSLGTATDSSLRFKATSNLANAIQALESDGFQVGTHSIVNTNANTYYYFAMVGPPPAISITNGQIELAGGQMEIRV